MADGSADGADGREAMSDERLAEIQRHYDSYSKHPYVGIPACCSAHASADDVPDLMAEVRALLDERERLYAIVAEANQRARALALLLLREGGQVEFTVKEQVSAPLHGNLVSYANPATGGLVLAYEAGDDRG